MDKKVSVIVPVYNIERYIEECIRSIVNQTYSNIEIILVNDGANDKSGEICERYQGLDERIRVIYQKNSGLASAVNTGLRHATGEYILFVDGDDWICLDAIEYTVQLIDAENADMVIYDFSYVPQFAQKEEYIESADNIGALKNLYNYDSKLNNIRLMTTVRWSKLYKRELLEGIVFPEGRIHEDEIAHEILYRANKIVYTNRKCYYYRQREGSIVHETLSIKKIDKLQSFKERIEFFERISNDELLSGAVNKFVYLYIQMFCKCILISNHNERKQFVQKLTEYGEWILRYKKAWNTKARLEMFLYNRYPLVLQKMYWIRHKEERMKEQIVVRVTGGLGNQMFQYAMAYVLSKRYPDRVVKLDTTWYRQIHVHNGFELMDIFNYDGHKLSLEVASDAEIRKAGRSMFTPVMHDSISGKIFEPIRTKIEWHYQRWCRKNGKSSIFDENICKKQGLDSDEIANNLQKITTKTRLVRGYWQEVKYAQEYIEGIRSEFLFPPLDSNNQKIKEEICSCDSVSVHIRRGDYVGSAFDVLPKEYYKKAIEYAREVLDNPHFFFFSDDEEYIKLEFEWVSNKTIVKGNKGKNSYKDMQLMSACKMNIIANSSFSKWAGLLNTNEGHKVLYSRYYHRDFEQEIINDDDWVLVE